MTTPETLGMIAGEEAIEHLGTVSTFTLDLEARWQAETGSRRLEIASEPPLIDLDVTIPAEPAVVWAHLTSPALRSRWEGPIVIEETLPDGRRGVGTLAQCVTGRLATLEEIVDWQPYDHIGWRLVVPDVGPVLATADLETAEAGTRVRLRWASSGEEPVGSAVGERLSRDKSAAFGRLANVVATGA